jgi:DNA-binding FadR family transcriptional regulator
MTSSITEAHPAPPRLTGELIQRLTAEIVAGKLAPRSRLPTEHALMETFGVSRTVVREAIAALRADGLVETRRGAGAFVAADPRKRPFRIDPEGLQSIQHVLDVMELRMSVEVEAAGLAALRRSRSDIAALNRACRAFARAVASGDEAIDLDFEFHDAIGAATGNPYFSSFLNFLGRLIIPRRSVHIDQSDEAERALYMQRVCDEHAAIAGAIVAQDVDAARRTMLVHLRRGRDRYRRAAPKSRSPIG